MTTITTTVKHVNSKTNDHKYIFSSVLRSLQSVLNNKNKKEKVCAKNQAPECIIYTKDIEVMLIQVSQVEVRCSFITES